MPSPRWQWPPSQDRQAAVHPVAPRTSGPDRALRRSCRGRCGDRGSHQPVRGPPPSQAQPRCSARIGHDVREVCRATLAAGGRRRGGRDRAEPRVERGSLRRGAAARRARGRSPRRASAAWFGFGTALGARGIVFTIRPHLRLVGTAVAADGLLDAGGCVFGARDAGGRRGDEHGSPCLPDGECDAGVGADERFLQRDRIRRVLGDQLLDALEDREQTTFGSGLRRRSPPPVTDGPEAPAAFVDDPVPACSRPWIDA